MRAGVLARALVAQQFLDRGLDDRRDRRAAAPALSGLRSRVSMPLPIRFVVVSWPPTMVTMVLAMTSSSVSRAPSTSAVISEWIRPSRGMPLLLADRGAEIGRHLLDAAQHARGAVGIVLEIAQHLREIRRPGLELLVIVGRNAEQFRGHDRRAAAPRNRRSHPSGPWPATASISVVGDALRYARAALDAARREGGRAKLAQPRMRRRVHEQHLLDHDLRRSARACARPIALHLLRRRACGRPRICAAR